MSQLDDDRNSEPDRDETAFIGRDDPERTIAAEHESTRVGQRRIGRYRLIEELGQGGQGAVWLAEDGQLGRRVALKILSANLAISAAAKARFTREAEVASKLDHPGIARIYEFGQEDDLLYIAMEHVAGMSLAASIAASRQDDSLSSLGLPRAGVADEETTSGTATGRDETSIRGRREAPTMVAAAFVADAAGSLHAAHESGLIHRDVKPANIMVRPDGRACILDFGLARDDSSEDAGLTQTGDVMGTPSYMAPEQVLPTKGGIDRRADVYALGVTLFECCTLRRPFEAPTRQELFHQILRLEPPRPRSINGRIPRDLEAIILTAMDRNPDRRYATALDLAEDLDRFRRHEPIRARPVGPLVRGLRWTRRNPTLATLLIAIALSLSIGVIVVARKNAVLERRGRELSRANDELTRRIESERRARLEADGVASLVETVLLSITSFEGKAAANVTVRALLDEIARRLADDGTIENPVRARVHLTTGNAYRGLGLADAAEDQWLLALAACRQAYPEGNTTTARVLHRLADGHTNRDYDGKVGRDQALAYLTEARAIHARIDGPDSTEVRTTLGTESAIELAGAVDAVTEPPASFVSLLAGFHPELSVDETRTGLSRELIEVSRLWAAHDPEGAADRVRFWIEPTLKGHPFVVNQSFVGMQRVADWAIDNAYPDFGAGLMYERLRAARRVRGEDSPFVGTCMSDFACFLERRGEAEEAYDWHERAVALLRRVCEPSSIVLLDALDYQARAALRSGRVAKAREIVTARLEVTLRDVKVEDPIFAEAFLMTGMVAGESEGPEARLRELDAGRDLLRERGAGQNLAMVLVWRAQALIDFGRLDEARADLERARSVAADPGPVRKDVARALADCAEALLQER